MRRYLVVLSATLVGLSSTGLAEDSLLQRSDFVYKGAFKLPQDWNGGSRFGYGGHALAFRKSGNAGRGSLYVAGHDYDQKIAEVTIPAPVVTKSPAKMPTARALHDFVDVSGGLKDRVPDAKLGGLLVSGGNLLWSFYKYYNVDGEHLPHHGVSSDDLSDPAARGLWSLSGVHMQRTAGYIAEIPAAWRARFGFPYLTGLSRPQGRATTSEGPAAFGYDPAGARDGAALRTKTFLVHDVDHPLTYWLAGSRRTWKGSDTFHGMVFLQSQDGQRSAVAAAMRLGTYPEDWYGEPDEFPGPLCDGGKGYHGGPYVTELWLYNPENLLKVASGKLAPSALRPYARVSLSPHWFSGECRFLGGISYDPVNRRIFLSEPGADTTNEFETQPIVHVLGHP